MDEHFKKEMNEWITQIRKEMSSLTDLPELVNENIDNIQHNYELIYELKDEIEDLKQEIKALKMLNLLSLKKTNKVA